MISMRTDGIDRALIDYYAAASRAFAPVPRTAGAAAVRARFERVAAAFSVPLSAGVRRERIRIPLERRTLSANLYRSAAGARNLPLLVYFHGGGWVVGDASTHEAIASNLALDARCGVASVEYRLAPEHPFPAPVDDAVDALGWLARHASRLGFAARRIGVGGDSAGAHLAMGAARMAAERDRLAVRAQLLLYPVARALAFGGSARMHAHSPGLSADEMRWYWAQFLSAHAPACDDVRAFPLARAPLHRPCRTIIVAARVDPLYDDAWAIARFIGNARGRVELIDAVDMTHGFARLQAHSKSAREWMRHAGRRLGEALRE